MAKRKRQLVCVGFNGFGQLDVPTGEKNGCKMSSDISLTSPRALLELPSPPVSVLVSSSWDSLYVYVSTVEGNSHTLCTGRWAGRVLEARKFLREGEDDILEVVETPSGQLILRTRERRLLAVMNRAGVSLECEDKSLKDVLKTSCLKNNGQIYSLLGSGVVHECVYDTKSYCVKLGRELPVEGRSVSDITCGADHCLLLTTSGDVLSFGLGTRGQLGHGDLDPRREPTLVEALAGVPMNTVASGLWHNMVLSQTGDLYSWGWNHDGQLGLRNPPGTTVTLPAIVDTIPESSGGSIVSVSCGGRHSAAVSEGGELFCWGWNGYGQVGGGGGCPRVHSVFCSHWSTLYLQSSDSPIS